MTYTQNKETTKANFSHASILIVEDNDDYWVLIQRALLEAMPEVRAIRAASREEAYTLFNNWSVDEWDMPKLVLLDLYLPERNGGFQVLAHIRELAPPCNQVPVVILSSSDVQADITEAYQRGSSSYLVKPSAYSDWVDYFRQLRSYWWETVTLPAMRSAW